MAKIEDMRGKSTDELKEMVLSLKKELFNLRFQVASGEMKNTARFRVVKRDIARAKTLLNTPEGAVAPVKKEKAPKAAKPAAETKTAAKAKKPVAKKKASGE